MIGGGLRRAMLVVLLLAVMTIIALLLAESAGAIHWPLLGGTAGGATQG